MTIPFIDVFAGPGGLNEGFSRLTNAVGQGVFHAAASFEMDGAACETLKVRSAYRRLQEDGERLRDYAKLTRGEISIQAAAADQSRFAKALAASEAEVHQIELGLETRTESDGLIRSALRRHGLGGGGPWVLIGGPPCQAYSLAGRSRRARDASFMDDKKHFLYREYLHILATFRPPVFVMENVKGLLSSTHDGDGMFHRILSDLSTPSPAVSYSIHSLVCDESAEGYSPSDFVIRAEEYGVPQRRHRVILLGIRDDLGHSAFQRLQRSDPVSVRDAIADLPPLRSGVSKGPDSLERWQSIRSRAQQEIPRPNSVNVEVDLSRGADWVVQDETHRPSSPLFSWLNGPTPDTILQHSSRRHMPDDLLRYWFAAVFAEANGVSPKLRDFPPALLPKHANADKASAPFTDRFRVQLWDRPSTTIVSHISKDGHYYIHPDPLQMRSLTVREAARLQTFPDDYFFMGNRTSQFTQVGNAVPPLLAHKIAAVVAHLLNES